MIERLILLLLLFSSPLSALENRLAHNPSPYLAMHGQDPVHWQPWSAEVLKLAQEQGKMIFISSGYFSCHWCHVMQRESYRNPEVAALLNQYFIPVKVDRELNTALDEHLIDFVQRTQGRAGWPLNVFLTPEGYPLVGTTYLPAQRFQALLKKLGTAWNTQAPTLKKLAREALAALQQARKDDQQASDLVPAATLLADFRKSALGAADQLSGGFGQQNRFPMTPQLSALLSIQAQHADSDLERFLRLTLDKMAARGLRDQLAGGFFRYTVDPQWLTPHYEKMLYTQALLAELYLQAAKVLKHPAYEQVAVDTLDFVLHDMKGKDDAYVASFSAVDGAGVEGGYYLWNPMQLKTLLPTPLLQVAVLHWQLDRSDEAMLPLQGATAEDIAKKLQQPMDQITQQIEQARSILLRARSQRQLPVDDKQLAGWNGLLLKSLALAAAQTGNPRFVVAGQKLRDYLVQALWDGQQLLRAKHQGKALGQAALADYAYVAEGLKAWAKYSKNDDDLKLSRQLLHKAWNYFYSDQGWRSAHQALLPGMPATYAQEDGALPAAVAVIMRLSLDSGDADLQQQAQRILQPLQQRIQSQPFWYASYMVLFNSEQKARPSAAAKSSPPPAPHP